MREEVTRQKKPSLGASHPSVASDSPTVHLFADTQATIKLASNPVYRPRSKHIGIQYNKVREVVEDDLLQISYI